MDITDGVPIGAAARLTGFSVDTLRYYERLGLVPPTARDRSGRRAYRGRDLDRLRFIARAKELGCSLDEIATLSSEYDAECRDVRARLGTLLEGKIVDARGRVTELIAFTAQLQDARSELDRSRAASASGPCGPGCICSGTKASADATPTIPAPVQLSASGPAVACTLDRADIGPRMAAWDAVLTGVTDRHAVDGGIRLALGDRVDLAEVARLARAESRCCSFFSFSITVDGRGNALEVRAPDDARGALTAVFGAAG